MSTTCNDWVQSWVGERELAKPGLLTFAAADYYVEAFRLNKFMLEFYDGIVRGSVPERGQAGDQAEKAEARITPWIAHRFSLYKALVCGLVFCRAVDMYLVYLTRTLTEVFRARPETLLFDPDTDADTRNVPIDFVLQYATRDEIIRALAEKRVELLAYAGSRALAGYFKKMKLPLLVAEHDMAAMMRVIELRNLIVHNNGLVSTSFLQKHPDCPCKADEHIALDTKSTWCAVTFIANSVGDIDQRATVKYSLRAASLRYENETDTQ